MARHFSPRSRHAAILLGITLVGLFFLWGPTALGVDPLNIAGIASSAVMKASNSLAYFILVLIGWGIAALSTVLGWLINFRNTASLPIIADLWHIVRDFCNLFFVLIMIVMAFATIFDLSAFGLGGSDFKSLIMKFLIAAVMINFSLAIGQFVVNTINIVNGVFLNALGDVSTRFGDVLNPAKVFFPLSSTTSQFQAGTWDPGTNIQISAKLFFSVIMGLIILFSMCVAVIFSIIRIPMIWVLLVFSPLAWLASILPRTRSFSNDWWTKFLAWNTFLPIFLFFLYIGMAFLGQQDKILESLSAGFTTSVVGATGTNTELVGGFLKSEFLLILQTLFFYVMTAIILVGGTKIAYESAGGATKWALGTARDLAWKLPVFSNYRAIETGAKEAYKYQAEKLAQEGLGFGKYRIGGQQAFERLRAQTAQSLGAPRAAEANLNKEAKYYQKQYEENNVRVEELRQIAQSSNSSNQQRLGAYLRLKDLKAADGDDLLEAYKLYGTKTFSAQNFALGLEFEKMSKDERARWLDIDGVPVTELEVRRKIVRAMRDEGELGLDRDKVTKELKKDSDGKYVGGLVEAVKLFDLPDHKKKLEQAEKKLAAATNTEEQKRLEDELKAIKKKQQDSWQSFLKAAFTKKPVETLRLSEQLGFVDKDGKPIGLSEEKTDGTRDDIGGLVRQLRSVKAQDLPSLFDIKLFSTGKELNEDEKLMRRALVRLAKENEKAVQNVEKSGKDNVTADQRQAAGIALGLARKIRSQENPISNLLDLSLNRDQDDDDTPPIPGPS